MLGIRNFLEAPTKLWADVFETSTRKFELLQAIMSMITATRWVPRGHAAPFPQRYDVNEAEFDRIAQLAKLQLEDAKGDLQDARDGKMDKEEDSDDESDGERNGVSLQQSKEYV